LKFHPQAASYQQRFPHSNTCSFTLSLPTCYNSMDSFKEHFEYAMAQPGFSDY
jgi:hypothetical protein